MAGPPQTGPRPGESGRDYLERHYAEAKARARGDTPSPPPVPPPAPAPIAPRVQAPAAITAEEAREARRRGVDAAIDRGEEPEAKPRSIVDALPCGVRRTMGLRGNRPRILRAHVPAKLPFPRETPVAAFKARLELKIAAEPHPGVTARCLRDVGLALLSREKDGRGFIQIGLKCAAKIAGYCVRQIQRAIDYLEAWGQIDVVNVMFRADNEWRRDENIYVPTIDAQPPPLPADVKAPDPILPASMSRAQGAGARLAALFNLIDRDGGLNASRERRGWTHPAPA